MATISKSVILPDEVRITYVEQGAPDGIPVLLLPGLGDSWRSYEPVLQSLPSTVRALALSQRGHGESSKPPGGYRVGNFAEDLAAFLDALSITAAVLVGHSSHGLVCGKFAIDHSDRTLGLILIGTPVTLRGNERALEMLEHTISKLTDPLDASFVRDFTGATLARALPPAFLKAIREETMKVPARVFKELFKDLLDTDLRPQLDGIRVPALLIWGDQDAILSRRDQEELAKTLPNARLVVYPGAGHSPHWEEPEQFASDLVAFIEGLGRFGASEGGNA